MKLTPEEKKLEEIKRLEREKAKPKWKGYMAYFMLVVTVIYIADEIVSQIGAQMQSVIASQVFAPIVGAEYAVARMAALSTFTMITKIAAMFYRPLSDRYGRKIFLFINTLGMGVGTIVVSLCTNIPVYLIGIMITGFFTPHDMQVVYVQECAPPEHRAKIFSIVKCFATLGILLIPVLRQMFIPGTDMSNWRYVYLVPGLLAVVAAIVSLVGMRESDAFIDSRLRLLKKSEEEIALEAENAKKKDAGKIGIWQGLKFVFSHKQTRWLMVASAAMYLGFPLTSNYETIMNSGYAQQFINAGMSLTDARSEASVIVTQALMLFSVGSAMAQLLPGFIADKLGRKKAVVVTSVITLACFLGYYYGSFNNANPYLVGALCGACIGAYWALTDLLMMVISESVPTTLRASVVTASNIAIMVPTLVASIGFMVITNVLGDSSIATGILIMTVPGMILLALTMMFKVKETNGVDLGAVTGNEFD